MNAATKVAAGKALLDERGPKDWRSRIDYNRLNVASTANCLLTQVFENEPEAQASGSPFHYGKRRLGIIKGDPFGFWPESDDDAADLKHEWGKVLNE